MPKCPKCKKNIKYLKRYTLGEKISFLTKRGPEPYCTVENMLNEPYTMDNDFIPSTKRGATDDFECPGCSAVLFKNSAKAEKFMKCKNPERD